ncbi:MAG: aldo/keto reductase [Kiritimatiellia bacterium]|jgi:aryl-alcohol dehydrogenase-like predicted oxidoreductase|nr:aldo/keto reductase [Kiritimatiellia bacterium]
MTFSRIMLGTVQFGLAYGVANVRGKPSFEQVCAILKAACEGGVTALDTAAAYGTSEEVLGAALEILGLREVMTVVSKVPPIPAGDDAAVERFIETTLRESLRRLRLERLDVCLLHREEDLRFLPLLEKMAGRGLIGGAGVSLDSARYLEQAAAARFIQLPCNALDRRFESFWPTAREKGITVFARSVYLQGLLLMPEETVPAWLAGVIPVRRALESIARGAGITMAELCMRTVLSNPAVTSVLTGVDTEGQMRENLSLAAGGPLPEPVLSRVRSCVPELPEALVRPALWPAREGSRPQGKT